jgi:hypothetical protein
MVLVFDEFYFLHFKYSRALFIFSCSAGQQYVLPAFALIGSLRPNQNDSVSHHKAWKYWLPAQHLGMI